MKHIRFHYIELDGPHPFAACMAGHTLHLMINAKAVVDQDEWVREYLLDRVADLALTAPPTAQQLAEVINMEMYLLQRSVHSCQRSTSHMITADRQ